MSGVDAPAEVREPPFGQLRLGATHRLERRALEGGEMRISPMGLKEEQKISEPSAGEAALSRK